MGIGKLGLSISDQLKYCSKQAIYGRATFNLQPLGIIRWVENQSGLTHKLKMGKLPEMPINEMTS